MKRKQALPDASGHFGAFGGQFVPETLMTALAELAEAYHQAREDEFFQRELASLLRDYAGRPTPLYFAENLSQRVGGADHASRGDHFGAGGVHPSGEPVGGVRFLRHQGHEDQGEKDREGKRQPDRGEEHLHGVSFPCGGLPRA